MQNLSFLSLIAQRLWICMPSLKFPFTRLILYGIAPTKNNEFAIFSFGNQFWWLQCYSMPPFNFHPSLIFYKSCQYAFQYFHGAKWWWIPIPWVRLPHTLHWTLNIPDVESLESPSHLTPQTSHVQPTLIPLRPTASCCIHTNYQREHWCCYLPSSWPITPCDTLTSLKCQARHLRTGYR